MGLCYVVGMARARAFLPRSWFFVLAVFLDQFGDVERVSGSGSIRSQSGRTAQGIALVVSAASRHPASRSATGSCLVSRHLRFTVVATASIGRLLRRAAEGQGNFESRS